MPAHSSLAAGTATAILCAACAFAQPWPSARDLTQETRGRVERFTITPQGEIDGFLFAGGQQAYLSSDLAHALGAAVRPGDMVIVKGYRSPAAPVIIVLEVRDLRDRALVAPSAPAALKTAHSAEAPPRPARAATLKEKVRSTLYGPVGDVTGAILQNGELLRLAPQTTNRAEILLSPGVSIEAQGRKLSTPYGSVVVAQKVTPPTVGETPAPRRAPSRSPERGHANGDGRRLCQHAEAR
ncbi:MAG TPA: hypothetical protein VED87_03775 [Methylocystis sp.]|nr:hypothetical protein [Methylocystis sp.]